MGTCEQRGTGQGHPDKGTGQCTVASPNPWFSALEWSCSVDDGPEINPYCLSEDNRFRTMCSIKLSLRIDSRTFCKEYR